jgi:leucyl/phenylalanyl-tRNA--protein transferase
MAIAEFPPIESADEHGLLAIGGDFEIESLVLAYSQGIFPWPINEQYPLAWFSPDPRGVLKYQDLHLSKSLIKFLKKSPYTVTFSKDFRAVIMNCANVPRKDNAGTWITRELMEAYIELHNKNLAYSVEVYEHEKLVGGLYGVWMNNFVSAESMFHLEDNTSKLAIVFLMEYLHEQGIDWVDTQMLTPVVEQMGGSYISRNEFKTLLQAQFQSV